MGGITLPTASTPGYGYFPAKYGPDVACDCLAAWIPVFSRLCVLKGYGQPVVWQLTGDNDASGGVHSQGGAVDFGGIGNARARLAREMGAWATWPRDWDNNQHTHAVLAYCPHNAPARYQLDAVRAGYNGLGSYGRAGTDPLKGSPSTYRSWSQGITWAKAEIARIEEEMVTPKEVWDYGIRENPEDLTSASYTAWRWVVNGRLDAGAAKNNAAKALAEADAAGKTAADCLGAVRETAADIDLLSTAVKDLTAEVRALKATVDALPKA